MNHDYIEEHHIIDRFLMGKLPEDEAEDFQDHAMRCQRCLDDLTYAERMQRGIQRVYETDAVSARGPARGLVAWWYERGSAFRVALALAALLVLAGPAFFFAWRGARLQRAWNEAQTALANLEGSEGGRVAHPLPNVPIFRLSPQRGAMDRPSSFPIRLGSSSEWLVLVLEVEARAGETLGARLLDREGKEIWTTEGLVVDEFGEVTLGLHAEALVAGDFSLILTKPGPGRSPQRVSRYAFQVIQNP